MIIFYVLYLFPCFIVLGFAGWDYRTLTKDGDGIGGIILVAFLPFINLKCAYDLILATFRP